MSRPSRLPFCSARCKAAGRAASDHVLLFPKSARQSIALAFQTECVRQGSEVDSGSSAFLLKSLVRFYQVLMPKFVCKLNTTLTCQEVEERLRENLRTGFLPNRTKHPFTGSVGAAEFKIGIDSWSEDSPVLLRGRIEEVKGETSIHVVAGPGISDMLEALAMGGIPCSVVVYFFELEMPTSISLALAGGSILAVLIRRISLRRFWDELDDGLMNLVNVLDASIGHRSHDQFGARIPEVDPKRLR